LLNVDLLSLVSIIVDLYNGEDDRSILGLILLKLFLLLVEEAGLFSVCNLLFESLLFYFSLDFRGRNIRRKN
jgi:hypothetical protein